MKFVMLLNPPKELVWGVEIITCNCDECKGVKSTCLDAFINSKETQIHFQLNKALGKECSNIGRDSLDVEEYVDITEFYQAVSAMILLNNLDISSQSMIIYNRLRELVAK